MKVLAIRLARFGDIVLLLPALNYLKARLPNSNLTFLTDRRWGPLAGMCPAVDEVLTVDRIEMRDGPWWDAIGGIRRLAAEVRRRKFDAVIDFHGFRETNLIARWSGASKRLGLQRFDQSFLRSCFNLPPVPEDKSIHVSEMFLRVARSFSGPGLETDLPPPLVLPEDARDWAARNTPTMPFAALYTDAPVPERIWPEAGFLSVAEHIVSRLQGSVVMVSDRPRQPHRRLPDGMRLLSGLTIPQLAATIARARILVSNDTGPMHLGPAFGVATLGIFSVGLPEHFRPTGDQDRFIRGNPIESVRTEEVIDDVNRIWAAATDR